jgi:hypothetical protein
VIFVSLPYGKVSIKAGLYGVELFIDPQASLQLGCIYASYGSHPFRDGFLNTQVSPLPALADKGGKGVLVNLISVPKP